MAGRTAGDVAHAAVFSLSPLSLSLSLSLTLYNDNDLSFSPKDHFTLRMFSGAAAPSSAVVIDILSCPSILFRDMFDPLLLLLPPISRT